MTLGGLGTWARPPSSMTGDPWGRVRQAYTFPKSLVRYGFRTSGRDERGVTVHVRV